MRQSPISSTIIPGATNHVLVVGLAACVMLPASLGVSRPAEAAGCVNGVYRAGCVGSNGAVSVRKAPVIRTRPVVVTPARPPVVVVPPKRTVVVVSPPA